MIIITIISITIINIIIVIILKDPRYGTAEMPAMLQDATAESMRATSGLILFRRDCWTMCAPYIYLLDFVLKGLLDYVRTVYIITRVHMHPPFTSVRGVRRPVFAISAAAVAATVALAPVNVGHFAGCLGWQRQGCPHGHRSRG